jgi:putative ABC transport system substrate-binding protein
LRKFIWGWLMVDGQTSPLRSGAPLEHAATASQGIGRRRFLGMLGGSVLSGPVAASAQQVGVPVVGFLNSGSPEAAANLVAAFRKGLSEAGFIEGRNVVLDYRWAHYELDRLPELAIDLVRRRVAVIAALASTPAALAAKAATQSIPIVFSAGADPVESGLVASLNRPGGNVTGIISLSVELMPKRLGVLRELLPHARRFAVFVDPNELSAAPVSRELRRAAAEIGKQIEVVAASTSREINATFASLVERGVEAALVSPATLFNEHRAQFATHAAYHRLPAIYNQREFALAGGLMSYGSSFTEQYRMTGVYIGRVLKGEKPFELPVMRADKFEFVINMQTVRLLSLHVPPTLLALADEVIE